MLIDGVDVRTLRCAELRRQISMVLQPPIVFPMSIHDNIAYGRPEATRAEVEAAARMAQAHDFIARLPEGYDTVIGEQGATLSEGERQRLTIARAVLRRAPILILDEPTSSVDVTTEASIMDGLERFIEGRTTVRHRASAEHRAQGGPHRGAAARRHRRAGHARRAAGARRRLRAHVRDAVRRREPLQREA